MVKSLDTFGHIKLSQLLKKITRSYAAVLETFLSLFCLDDFNGVCPLTGIMIMLMLILVTMATVVKLMVLRCNCTCKDYKMCYWN